MTVAPMVRRLLGHWTSVSPAVKREGTRWYQAARSVIRAMARRHGVQARCAAGIVAALSPRLQWAPNLRAADAVLRGAVPSGVFKTSLHKAQRIREGSAPLKVLSGPKTRAFYRALTGDERAAVVDVWTMRAAVGAAIGAEVRITADLYDTISMALAIAARRARTTVVRLQATAWVSVRGRAQ